MPTFMITSEPHSVQLSAEGRTSLVNCNDGRVVERPLLFVSITSVCLHPEVEGRTGRCQDEHSPGQEWGRTHCLSVAVPRGPGVVRVGNTGYYV